MAFRRNNITKSGLQGLAEKYINDNFMALFSKVSGGNINYTDLDTNTQKKILTQWIPFQMEGNLDANYPLETRFYLPPCVKEVKSASFSAVASNYRMDSDVALNDPTFNIVDLNISMSSGSTVVGTTTSGGGGAISETFYVEKWGTPPYQYSAPSKWVYENSSYIKPVMGGFVTGSSGSGLGTVVASQPLNSSNGVLKDYVDFRNWQHTHYLSVPSHTHGVSGAVSSHSHEGTARVELPQHVHKLNEGIKQSTKQPSSIEVQFNKTKVGRVLSGTNDTMNDVDVSKQCKIGWNTIRVIGAGVGRITLYGVVEVLIDQYWDSTKKSV